MPALHRLFALTFLLGASLLAAGCGDDKTPAPIEPIDLTGGASSPEPGSAAAGHGAADMSGSPDGASTVPMAGDLAPLPDPVSTEPAVADSLEAFHARMKQLLEACAGDDPTAAEANARDLLLANPGAWFAEVFGAKHKRLPGLVKEYEARAAQLASLPTAIHDRMAAGQTEAQTERFIDADDELATGFQAHALRGMQKPIALYSLRLMEKDADAGWHLWSFAHVDGQFRFVGQMAALSPAAVDKLLRQLGSLRIKDANEVREEWKKK